MLCWWLRCFRLSVCGVRNVWLPHSLWLSPALVSNALLGQLSAFAGHTHTHTLANSHTHITSAPQTPMRRVIFLSIAVCACVYTILLYGSLSTFGPLIDHDLLKMYPRTAPILVCRCVWACVRTSCLSCLRVSFQSCRQVCLSIRSRAFATLVSALHQCPKYPRCTSAVCHATPITRPLPESFPGFLLCARCPLSTIVLFLTPLHNP